MTLNVAFLPAAVANGIQDGILERRLLDALKPALLWRMNFTDPATGVSIRSMSRDRHEGRLGEAVTKSRRGLIPPGDETSAKIQPGQEPSKVRGSEEFFSYQLAPYGASTDTHLVASHVAAWNKFVEEVENLMFHGAQTLGRIARGRVFSAYGGSDTFATAAGSSATAVIIKDATGFDTVLVNGKPTPVSATYKRPIKIGGIGRNVTAVDLSTNTLTIDTAHTWSQYDRVVADDAPFIVRAGARATDRLIVGTDTAKISYWRDAKAFLQTHNVPGINGQVGPGAVYGAFVDAQIKNALYADAEFYNAIQRNNALAQSWYTGALGLYDNILFLDNQEMPVIASGGDYQTDIHRSLVFGGDMLVEAYIPDEDFSNEVTLGGVARANHYKLALDQEGVLTLTVRAPLDALARNVTSSWSATCDWAVPSDATALTGKQRFKRAVVVHTAGPPA
jgi:hypothetical protein